MGEELQLIEEWNRSLKLMHYAHHASASYYSKWNLRLGISLSFLSAIVGTSVLIVLAKILSPPYTTYTQLGAALLSFLIAAITGIQTFVNFPERRQKHHKAAAEFQKARRLLQQIESGHIDEKPFDNGLSKVRQIWYEALKGAPNLPSHIHDKARKSIYPNDL